MKSNKAKLLLMQAFSTGVTARSIATLVLAIYAPTLAVFSRPSYAVLNNQDNALGVNSTKLKNADVNCDQFCDKLLSGEDTNKLAGDQPGDKVNNTDYQDQYSQGPTHVGSGGWTHGAGGNSDDQWCANHGVPTDASVGPSATPTPGPSSGPGSCNVPMLSTDNGNCGAVNAGMLMCKYHGSQVIPQCLAYKAAGQAVGFDYVMAAIDIAVVATCTTVCVVDTVAAGATEQVCEGAAIVAGAAEFIDTMVQRNGAIGTTIGALASATGIILGSAGLAAEGMTVDGAASTTKMKLACATAVMFAIMAGIRIYNIVSINNTKSDACKNLQQLVSQAASTDPSGQQDLNYNNFTPTNGTGGSGGLGNNGSGGNTGGGGGGGGGGNLGCLGNGGVSGCGVAPPPPGSGQQATDSGVLTRSGIDKVAAPLAQQLDANGLKDRMKSGAGAAIAGALPASAGDFGAGLSKLAQQAQDNAPDLGLGAVGGSVMSSGGGGGGAKGGDNANPFGNLFGGAAAATPQGGAAKAEFGRKPAASDIWHTGTTMNIFEIISEKVGKVSNRVGAK